MNAPRKPAPPRRKATDETNGHLTGRAASLAAIEPHKFQKGQPRPAGAGRKKRATAQSLLDELIASVEHDVESGRTKSAGRSVQVLLLQKLLDHSPQVAAEIAKRILPPAPKLAPVNLCIDVESMNSLEALEKALNEINRQILNGGDIQALSVVAQQLTNLVHARIDIIEAAALAAELEAEKREFPHGR